MAGSTTGSTGYRGRDRRTRWPVRASATAQAAVAAAVGLPAVLGTAALIVRAPSAAAAVLDAAPLVWIVALSWSSLGLYAVWRSTGLVRDAWVGGALAVTGLAPAVGWHVDRVLGAEHPLGAWPSGLAASLAGAVLVFAAARSAPVDTSARQRTVLTCVAGLLALAVAVHVALWVLGPAVGSVARVALVLVVASAVAVVPLGCRGLDPDVRRALVVVLPAAGAPVLLHEIVAASGWGAAAVLLALLVVPAQAVAAALALHLAVVRSAAAASRSRGRERVLLARLDGLRIHHSADSARRHEARGALAAVALANTALLESAGRLDDSTRRELVDGVVTELRRISTLLAPETDADGTVPAPRPVVVPDRAGVA